MRFTLLALLSAAVAITVAAPAGTKQVDARVPQVACRPGQNDCPSSCAHGDPFLNCAGSFVGFLDSVPGYNANVS